MLLVLFPDQFVTVCTHPTSQSHHYHHHRHHHSHGSGESLNSGYLRNVRKLAVCSPVVRLSIMESHVCHAFSDLRPCAPGRKRDKNGQTEEEKPADEALLCCQFMLLDMGRGTRHRLSARWVPFSLFSPRGFQIHGRANGNRCNWFTVNGLRFDILG